MPCKNDATCLDDIGIYRCICMAGYEGVNCTEDVDECASSPCLNSPADGCIHGINSYTCTCNPGMLQQ